jgi:hypothetical protein
LSNEQHPQEIVDRSTVLSFLLARSKDFDTLLLKARDQFPGPEGWVGPLLLRSLFGMNYQKMPEESTQKITAIFSNNITVWVTWIAGIIGISFTTLNWLAIIDPLWPSIISVGWFILTFLFSILANFSRMLTLDDPYFTPVMYKFFRTKEYYLIFNYLKSEHTFEWAYDMTRTIYKEHSLDDISTQYEKNSTMLRREIEDLKASLAESDENLKEAENEIDEMDEQLKLLIHQVQSNEDGFNTAIDTLYRLRQRTPSLFVVTDLHIISNFSLFELVDDGLYMIGEQGTTETPSYIDIHDQEYAHYSSVKLISSEKTVEYATSNREGRTVASYWIELPSGRVLIYNFHYASTNEYFRDTIESKEMYRLIRIICILLDERGLLNRDGVQHGQS